MTSFSLRLIFIFVAECIKIKIRHEALDVINYRSGLFDELIKILLVKENFVPLITIAIKSLLAFCDREVVIVSAGSPDIKKVSSPAPCTYFP